MAGNRELPKGRHDPHATGDLQVREAFETVVRIKGELAALLESTAAPDQQILRRCGRPADPSAVPQHIP
jgi:hypothetical protein